MPYWTPGSTGALPLTRTLGDWSLSLLILHEEMQDLDQKSAAAVNRNGDTVSGNFTWSGNHTFNTGTHTISGALTLSGAVTASGAWTASSTWNFTSASKVTLAGRRVLRRARVTLADATQTVKVSQGDLFELPSPAAPRVITLDHTIDSPTEGEVLEFVCPALAGGGTQYSFKREDATVVATFVGPTVSTQAPCFYAQFERTGGVWRLAANSGCAYDGGAPADYGVIPGAGA